MAYLRGEHSSVPISIWLQHLFNYQIIKLDSQGIQRDMALCDCVQP